MATFSSEMQWARLKRNIRKIEAAEKSSHLSARSRSRGSFLEDYGPGIASTLLETGETGLLIDLANCLPRVDWEVRSFQN
jgi:hypothetical protein